jgi:hypothetical protein
MKIKAKHFKIKPYPSKNININSILKFLSYKSIPLVRVFRVLKILLY